MHMDCARDLTLPRVSTVLCTHMLKKSIHPEVLKHFPDVLLPQVLLAHSLDALAPFGFTAENTIATVGVCRDEIAAPFANHVRLAWGEAFNISSLAGIPSLGPAGIRAVRAHGPVVDARRRYVFFCLTHLAINAAGEIGICTRRGVAGPSHACGALWGLHGVLTETKDYPKLIAELSEQPIDPDSAEFSLLARRVAGHLRTSHPQQAPDLVALTKITAELNTAELDRLLSSEFDSKLDDWAVFAGIQIHGPHLDCIWLNDAHAVISGEKHNLLS